MYMYICRESERGRGVQLYVGFGASTHFLTKAKDPDLRNRPKQPERQRPAGCIYVSVYRSYI